MSASINKELLSTISKEIAWNYKIVPKGTESNKLEVYIAKETIKNKEEIEFLIDKEIVCFLKESNEILELLQIHYTDNSRNEGREDVYDSNIKIVNLIIEAKRNRCSDIHLECSAKEGRIRFRVDGQLMTKYKIPVSKYSNIINQVKIQSNLDISEKRLPQDGRILIEESDEKFDVRVSTSPSIHGEKIVLRILKQDATNITIENVGFDEIQLSIIKNQLLKPHGLVLISGPTGSGKTTTLYSFLNVLNKSSNNILTIEDPVEYTLDGLNQVQLKEDIGLTFTKALKSFLRQDPDIIVVGEIRDEDTAKIAVRAALTGHLVLSTIHTNSATETYFRLLDMGIPEYLIKSCLNVSISQRLIRLLCINCKKQSVNTHQEINEIYSSLSPENHFCDAVGCSLCNYSGYKGRKAIFELAVFKYSDLNSKEEPEPKTSNLSLVNSSLKQQAIKLLNSGETSIEEIYSLII